MKATSAYRRSIPLRHIEATHDRFGGEPLTQGHQMFNPAGQQTEAPTGTMQFVSERLADTRRRTDDDRRTR